MGKISLCLIITLISFGLSAQTPLRWNYPCKPGTECWNALTSVAERQNACQITGIELKTLSTEELLLITMEHPFFRSYIFHDSPTDGIGFAINGFNGFQEFLNRKDALKTLLDVYAREDFAKVLQIRDSIQIGEYTLKWTGAELLMTLPAIWKNVSNEQCKVYASIIHDKVESKRRLNGLFSGTSFAASALTYRNLCNCVGQDLPSRILSLEGFDLFETKLIVKNNDIVGLLLDELDLLISKK